MRGKDLNYLSILSTKEFDFFIDSLEIVFIKVELKFFQVSILGTEMFEIGSENFVINVIISTRFADITLDSTNELIPMSVNTLHLLFVLQKVDSIWSFKIFNEIILIKNVELVASFKEIKENNVFERLRCFVNFLVHFLKVNSSFLWSIKVFSLGVKFFMEFFLENSISD